MSTIGNGHRRRFAHLVGVLLLASHAHIAAASNSVGADKPEGFGADTTGGAGGEVVRARTAKSLAYLLCRKTVGGVCTDDAPRIIELATTIDFTGTEGTGSSLGCQPGRVCVPPDRTESLVLLNPSDTHCAGKPITQIAFDEAGRHALTIGSNKTLIGVGADAGLKGKGLQLNGVHNVIIRNLTISEINHGIVFAGDAIYIAKADHVWIDHNRFHDIGRQMIAAGYGATTSITISWNDFCANSQGALHRSLMAASRAVAPSFPLPR